jgi:hypothetical protein
MKTNRPLGISGIGLTYLFIRPARTAQKKSLDPYHGTAGGGHCAVGLPIRPG